MKNKIFSDQVIRTGREHELDWARAFAIVFMVLIHVFMFLCAFEENNIIYIIVCYLGSPPAAPVFMFVMGISMVYSRKNTPALLAKRGIGLLVMAYALNAARATVPYAISRAMGEEFFLTLAEALLLGDIMQLAGLSFLLMALLNLVLLYQLSAYLAQK